MLLHNLQKEEWTYTENKKEKYLKPKINIQQQAIENLQKEEKLSSLQADFLRRLVAINIPSLNNKANDLVIKLSNEDFANLEKDINATFEQFTVRTKERISTTRQKWNPVLLFNKNTIRFKYPCQYLLQK